ncbi:MAG: 4-hydroxybutyryl-CoA dehydratase [Deltaproteobacteria bacterium]|nr:4-hydroxybutyryl-CoA dehydratase [Deltaproteobacteria bacterium]
MKTAQEYIDSIGAMHPVVYAFGEKVTDIATHPCFRPTLNSVGLTYAFALMPEHEDLLTVASPQSKGRINRMLHICRSPQDLVDRALLGRFLTPHHGACVGARCPGTAALNALFATTFEMDAALGTEYHSRFLKFLYHIEQEDLSCSGMATDAKGDRSKRPSQQADPDLYLHIVSSGKEGIVVRGAKAHQSGAAIAHENIVVPTMAMGAGEEKFALAFAVPCNAPGVIHIAEAPAPNARRFLGDAMDFGNDRYGVHGSTLVVFNDVFVPAERVFLCGETGFTASLVQRFASFQRLSSAACKSGHCDLVLGAAALAAEYNGCEGMTHIRDKLTEISFQATLAMGSAIAAAQMASRTPSGAYTPHPLYVNAAKLQAANAVWEASRLACEITGGVICTAPSQRDFDHPDIGRLVEKFFKGRADIPAEDRIRIVRLVEYLVGQSSIVPTESIHGGGPPATQRLLIRQATNIDYYKTCARNMAGIGGARS